MRYITIKNRWRSTGPEGGRTRGFNITPSDQLEIEEALTYLNIDVIWDEES